MTIESIANTIANHTEPYFVTVNCDEEVLFCGGRVYHDASDPGNPGLAYR